MAKLFPFRPESQHEAAGPRLVDLDDEVADDVFAALSSDTARGILSRLYRDPATASDVADAVDTSLQNARYHLDKLESAGLIEPVDTWYSSRGTEMTVYAPTNEPLVVAAGREESKGVLRRALERVVGAVTVLALASVVVDRLVRQYGGPTAMFASGGPSPADSPGENGTVATTDTPPGSGGGEGTGGTETATPASMETTTEAGMETAMSEATQSGTPFDQATGAAETQAAAQTPTPTAGTEGTAATVRATDTTTNATTTTAEMAADGGVDLLSAVPPGGLFFAGGLLVVLLVAAWWYWGEYRPMYG